MIDLIGQHLYTACFPTDGCLRQVYVSIVVLVEICGKYTVLAWIIILKHYKWMPYQPKYTPPLSIFLQSSLPPFGACSKVDGHLQEYDVLVKLSIALLYLEKDVILLNNFYNAPSA